MFVSLRKGWKVSRTVLQVISTYLSFPARLLYIKQAAVEMFDVEIERWKVAFEYPRLCDFETWSATMVTEREVGAVVAGRWDRYLTTYLLSEGHSRRQADFSPSRTDFGLVYSSVQATIYVFGGLARNSPEASSGALVLEASDWEALPSMTSPRYAFNPVIYGVLVYLCGGGVPSIETFNPYSKSFRRISAFQLPPDPVEQWETSSSLGDSTIVILSGHSLSQFNPTAGTFHSKQLAALSGQWRSAYSPSAPVVVGNCLYAVDCVMRVVQRLNIHCGRLEARLTAS